MMNNKAKVNTPAGVPDVSKAEVEQAQTEGVLEAFKEGAKDQMRVDTGTTGDLDGDAERFRVSPSYNTTPIAPLLDLHVDELIRRATKDDVEGHIDFEAAKALLALERSGRNRTTYVKALCKVIGVKSPMEVTSAGPSFTNDDTPVTAL